MDFTNEQLEMIYEMFKTSDLPSHRSIAIIAWNRMYYGKIKDDDRVNEEPVRDTLIDLEKKRNIKDSIPDIEKMMRHLEDKNDGYIQIVHVSPMYKHMYWVCVADLNVISKISDGKDWIRFEDFYKKEYTEGDKLNI